MRKSLSVYVAALIVLATCGLDLAANAPARVPSPEGGRLDVGASLSPDGVRITSQKDKGDGTKVLHGVQVIVGSKNWVKEYAVYNNGSLEQRVQFYPNGRTFRRQWREQNGDGEEVVYAPNADVVVAKKVIVADGTDIGPIKVQELLCHGTVKADKRWEGTFLVWEGIPMGFGFRLAVQEYVKGELAKSTPFPAKKLDLPEDTTQDRGWLWDSPNWPTPLHPRSR